MKGDLQIALEIDENISLAKRLAGQLNALAQITGHIEQLNLQSAVKCVDLAIMACELALEETENRASNGVIWMEDDKWS